MPETAWWVLFEVSAEQLTGAASFIMGGYQVAGVKIWDECTEILNRVYEGLKDGDCKGLRLTYFDLIKYKAFETIKEEEEKVIFLNKS